jgi:predicted PurR-regulated permease PerM
MNTEKPETTKSLGKSTKEIIHLVIQLLALAFIMVWCFEILAPFLTPIIWAAILAIALFPLHQRLKKLLGGRNVLAAVLVTIFFLGAFISIVGWLGIRTGSEIKQQITGFQEGKIKIQPPSEKVKDWPLIGRKAYQVWSQMASGAANLIDKYPEEIKSAGNYILDLVTTSTKALVVFILSIIVSGVFLCYAKGSGDYARKFFSRLIDTSYFDITSIATVTIRNVVRGILGVALIQSLCAGLGFFVAGIPYAGVWTLACLILAIVQIGIIPVTIGVLIYIWTTGHTTTAILLTIWMIPVGLLDNILKPVMMGKGAPVPMLVIFLGSLGGFMYSGFVGLFTGAVVLSLGYRLFDVWLKETEF